MSTVIIALEFIALHEVMVDIVTRSLTLLNNVVTVVVETTVNVVMMIMMMMAIFGFWMRMIIDDKDFFWVTQRRG